MKQKTVKAAGLAAPEDSWKIPFRCKICPDGPGEGADIMAGDQWVDCAPDPEFSKIDKGTNAMIVRTLALFDP